MSSFCQVMDEVEAYFEVSTASVVLIELAPDPHRKTTQIAPNGKSPAPQSGPMSPLRSGTDETPVKAFTSAERRLFSSASRLQRLLNGAKLLLNCSAQMTRTEAESPAQQRVAFRVSSQPDADPSESQ